MISFYYNKVNIANEIKYVLFIHKKKTGTNMLAKKWLNLHRKEKENQRYNI